MSASSSTVSATANPINTSITGTNATTTANSTQSNQPNHVKSVELKALSFAKPADPKLKISFTYNGIAAENQKDKLETLANEAHEILESTFDDLKQEIDNLKQQHNKSKSFKEKKQLQKKINDLLHNKLMLEEISYCNYSFYTQSGQLKLKITSSAVKKPAIINYVGNDTSKTFSDFANTIDSEVEELLENSYDEYKNLISNKQPVTNNFAFKTGYASQKIREEQEEKERRQAESNNMLSKLLSQQTQPNPANSTTNTSSTTSSSGPATDQSSRAKGKGPKKEDGNENMDVNNSTNTSTSYNVDDAWHDVNDPSAASSSTDA